MRKPLILSLSKGEPISLFVLAILMAVLLACSPEASRVRNGGPGADVGNVSPNSPSPSTPPPLPGG